MASRITAILEQKQPVAAKAGSTPSLLLVASLAGAKCCRASMDHCAVDGEDMLDYVFSVGRQVSSSEIPIRAMSFMLKDQECSG